jgi:hypothetical protein
MSRNTHDRNLDHHGTDPTSNSILAVALEKYAVGTSLDLVIQDLAGRVTAIEDVLGIKRIFLSSVVNATIDNSFLLSAEIVV